MTVIPITCDNCGAKYKLPPTFKGSQAKCQKCGSVIDVAKQREAMSDSPAAAAKPAAARPAAAAKPAVDRSKGKGGGRAAGRGKADADDKPKRGRAAAGGRSRRGDADDGDEAAPRRSRAERQKQNNQMPLIVGGVSLLAIVVVVVVFLMMDDGKKDGTEEQASNKTNTEQGTKPDDGGAKPEDGTKPDDGGTKPEEGAKPDDGGAKPEEGAKPAEGGTTLEEGVKPAEGGAKPADPPVDTGDPNRIKEPWEKQRNPPQTMDQVRSAAERFGEVSWPESIDATKKAAIQEIISDIEVDGGLRHIRAKRKLVTEGYAALFGIAEKLRELDYRQPGDAGLGFEMNKVIEEITGGLNARYAAVQAGETMHPAKAEWNTKTVNAWMKMFAKWPDEATFKKSKRERAKKNG